MNKPVGIIDVGSNSLRLAIFANADRALVPLYNEKEICEIGRGLEATGKLNPAGKESALKALARFKLLAESRGIKNIPVLATEAMREAQDGRAFAEEVRLQTGLKLDFISGADEARYSAAGVRFGIQNAVGIMGDLGGGSLELAQIGLQSEQSISLPLGPLRLADSGDIKAIEHIIHGSLRDVDWLAAMHKRTFYAVGGAWRTIAKSHIKAVGHPLNVIHEYEVDARVMADYALQLTKMTPEAIGKLKGVSHKRREHLAMAALLLERIIAFGRPDKVCFSVTGLREGYLFSQLDAEEQQADPLLIYCRKYCEAESVASVLTEWTARLWKTETANEARLREAVCCLSNLEWGDHPEYRARQAYQHALALPVGGIDHPDRCFIALASYVRHTGETHKSHNAEAFALLSEGQIQRAVALGCVLRLAYELTGGMSIMLQGTALKLENNELSLTLNVKREGLLNDTVERRLAAAAIALNAAPKINLGRA